MADANRLSTQVTSYTVFEENQVLTSQQLNQLTDYLDRQQRLTRARLIGIGILCGLELQILATEVKLGKGVALTSDGDLLEIAAPRSFSQFRKFDDEKAQYPQFRPAGNLLPLFELVEAEGVPLADFKAETGQELKSMAALLYLESYFYDPDLCTGSGCDNLGKEARNNPRVLLIDGAAAGQLLGDLLLLGRRYPLLPQVVPPRVILDPDKIGKFDQLVECYKAAIERLFKNTALKEALQKTWHPLIRPLLSGLYPQGDPTGNWLKIINEWLEKVRNNPFAIQYLYDFLLDLIRAYAEFKEALFAENLICVPPVELFPKHVLLGGTEGQSDSRHAFYPSPQCSHQTGAVARVRFLHQRLDRMINLFRPPASASDLRITPSRLCCANLGGRAIPYYYKADKDRPLSTDWSFELSQRGLQNGIYNYFAADLGGSDAAGAPLDYDLSDYDFFRIEGHLGAEVDKVESRLKALIDDKNLPIQVLPLQIETGPPPFRIRPLGPLRDLKVMHRLYRQDLLMNLGNMRTFTAKLKETVEQAEDLPAKDVQADTLSYKAFVGDGTVELDQALNKLSSGLKVNFNQFKVGAFEADYQDAVQKTAGINKGVRGVTYASAFTPYETLLNDSKFKYLGWIEGILDKRRKRAEELSVFASFLKEAPAMEHLGGVPKGGTFVLVYSAETKRVVADFCLPYWHVDLPEAEEPEEQVVEETDLKWTNFNDFLIKRADTKVLAEEIGKLKENFNLFDVRLTGQESGLKVYAASLKTYTDTVFDTTGKVAAAGGFFSDQNLGAEAGMLDMLGQYMEMINAKEAKGQASTQEVAMKQQAEAMSGRLIQERVKGFQARGTDVMPGSEEEQFLKVAIATNTRMTDVTAKKQLSDSMAKVQADAGAMTYMSNMLNGMIMK